MWVGVYVGGWVCGWVGMWVFVFVCVWVCMRVVCVCPCALEVHGLPCTSQGILPDNSPSVAHLVCWDTVGGHYAVAMQNTVDLYSLEVRDK